MILSKMITSVINQSRQGVGPGTVSGGWPDVGFALDKLKIYQKIQLCNYNI